MYPFLCFAFSISLHPIWAYIFIVKYDLKINGVALASTITWSITYALLRLVIWYKDVFKDSKVPFLDKSTIDVQDLY